MTQANDAGKNLGIAEQLAPLTKAWDQKNRDFVKMHGACEAWYQKVQSLIGTPEENAVSVEKPGCDQQ